VQSDVHAFRNACLVDLPRGSGFESVHLRLSIEVAVWLAMRTGCAQVSLRNFNNTFLRQNRSRTDYVCVVPFA
jgi:hypothetical protein